MSVLFSFEGEFARDFEPQAKTERWQTIAQRYQRIRTHLLLFLDDETVPL